MTQPFPTGIIEFSQMFTTERACEQYLFAMHFPEGFRCPKCGSTKFYEYEGLRVVQCPSHHHVSMTADTVMHRSRQPLLAWFWAAYFISTHTPGISAVQFQKHLQIHLYETAFMLLHKVRSALVSPDRDPLHGVVEMDETYITNKGQEKVIIIGAVEVRDRPKPKVGEKVPRYKAETPQIAGRVRFHVIPDETAVSFVGFATSNVLRGSVIHTDGDPSYNGLAALGYDHRPKVQGKGKAAVYGLEHLHRAFANFKTWLSGTHHDAVSAKHMPAYCNEYVFRHNRRGNPWLAFNTCLGLAVEADTRPEYDTLFHAGDGVRGWVHPGRA